MSITAKQYQKLQAEASRMAEDLPPAQVLAGLIATYEAGRLLRMTRGTLIGLLGSVALRCIDSRIDEGAPPVPPEPGMWPRVVLAAAYDESDNLLLSGIDDNDQPWQERCGGRGPEAWLLKQLLVERRYGRRPRRAAPRRNGKAG